MRCRCYQRQVSRPGDLRVYLISWSSCVTTCRSGQSADRLSPGSPTTQLCIALLNTVQYPSKEVDVEHHRRSFLHSSSACALHNELLRWLSWKLASTISCCRAAGILICGRMFPWESGAGDRSEKITVSTGTAIHQFLYRPTGLPNFLVSANLKLFTLPFE